MTQFKEGFSLVEVTLAIGIIAFAFVALFGLLPTGMQTFRASIDSTNDAVMVQDMNAMVQVTPWSKIDSLAEKSPTGDIYYYDEEGRRTDSERHPSKQPGVVARRLYQVKLLVEPLRQATAGETTTDTIKDGRRVIVIIGDYVNKQSRDDFDQVDESDSKKLSGNTTLRSRPLIVTRMESSFGN